MNYIASTFVGFILLASAVLGAEGDKTAPVPIIDGPAAKAFEEPKKKEEAAPDKSKYNLFKPVPKDQMREMNTDRPDKTESPFTVDAGHFQLELDMLSFTYDRRNPEHEL